MSFHASTSKLLDKKWKLKVDKLEKDRLSQTRKFMSFPEPIKPQFLKTNLKREELQYGIHN